MTEEIADIKVTKAKMTEKRSPSGWNRTALRQS